jgi:hypothetical protein
MKATIKMHSKATIKMHSKADGGFESLSHHWETQPPLGNSATLILLPEALEGNNI